ncbi:MAG: metal-dependent transcriptional regulator [Candidatus Promineifilaceae bacterium]|nr:metal-dependent transcriptional regulator [Candidatus Promineifilaceae bacterium]
MKHESFNESTEMYLKTIIELAESDETAVPISALADRMGVSNVSATEMVHRLEKRELLNHEPYRGVRLSPTGRLRAAAIIRSHHMWEVFLARHLELPWEKVHDYSCRLEHATNSAVTEALATYLEHPQRCPHGNAIPDRDGRQAVLFDMPLTKMEPGQKGVISRITPESTLLLEYLAKRKMKPGQVITFDEVAPFNGPLMVTCAGDSHALGREVAAHIYVELDEKESN